MSKITKTICDNCQREMRRDEWYVSAKITEENDSVAQQICDGDYCKKCFKARVDKL